MAAALLLGGCYLSHTRDPRDASVGPEGGYPDAGPVSPRSGRIEFGHNGSAYSVYGWFGDVPLQEAVCPTLRESGTCRLVLCPGPELAGDAGSVDVEYRDTTILNAMFIPGDGYGDYEGDVDGDGVSDTGMPPIALEDGLVTIRVTGGRDVPAFRQAIAVPRPFTLLVPESISRPDALRVAWEGAAADDMLIRVLTPRSPDPRMIFCSAPVGDGELTVPAELLGELVESSELWVYGGARETERVTAGDYAVEVNAYFGRNASVAWR